MKIPKSWDKVPLNRFVDFLECKDLKIEDTFEKICIQGSAILGIEKDEVKKLPINELQELVKLIGSKLPSRLMLTFKHKGYKYRAVVDARKLDGAKYSAIKLLQKDGYKRLHQVLLLVSEPRKFGFRKNFPFIGYKSYELKPSEFEQRVNDFKTLPLEVAYPMSAFFLKVCKELKDHLSDYSIQEMNKMEKKLKQIQADLEADTDL